MSIKARLARLAELASRSEMASNEYAGARETLERRLERLAERIEAWRQDRGLTLEQLRDHLLQHGSEAELMASGCLTAPELQDLLDRTKERENETIKRYHL